MITLLLADSHEMVAESLGLALDGAPDVSVVGLATTLDELFPLAAARQAQVLLLDQRLCEGGVAAAVAAVHKVSPDTRLLMLTSGANESSAVAALDAGCAGVVPKTASLDDLVGAVRATAAGELRLDSALLARLVPRLSRGYREPGSDLTAREREVLRLVAQGLSTTEMAAHLFVSPNTVRNHVQSILSKLGAHSKLEALVIATRGGLLE